MRAPTEETDEVRAFIAARRMPVLVDATRQLRDAAPADLAAITHRLHGILGSYGLDRADALVVDLAQVVADAADSADADAAVVDAAREHAVAGLQALVEGADP